MVLLDMEVLDAAAAENLVRELELRDLEAAKDVERNVVHVAVESVDGGEPLILDPLVAIEGWLHARHIASATVSLDGASNCVRARG